MIASREYVKDLLRKIFKSDKFKEDLNEYSYDKEMIIGKWVDGKPIYRKTYKYNTNFTLTAAKWYVTTINVSELNIEHMVGGKCVRTNGGYTVLNDVSLAISGSKIELLRGATITVDTCIIVIEYTKTTD